MPDGFEQLRRLQDEAPELVPPDDGPPNDDTPDEDVGHLPAGCPVQALGVSGQKSYYLDALGQLQALNWKEHSNMVLRGMFGEQVGFLFDNWPRKQQDKQSGEWKIIGYKPEDAGTAMMKECARLGVWKPEEKVRGAGSWKGADGELILHTGKRLLVVPAGAAKWYELRPGVVHGFVYPTAPQGLLPAPKSEPGSAEQGVGSIVLAALSSWNWFRPDLDPVLALGWAGAAMLGGASPWRPLMWTSGGFGTGKSTLQEFIKSLLGPNGILQTSDTTAAGIRQVLKYDSRPVGLDEAEADEDNRKMKALVKLARDAATGALSIRGGSDHEASMFTLRSCFLFSSILIPPLSPQDQSRICVLNLKPLEGNAAPPKFTARQLAELGSRLLRRLIDGWSRFDETLEAFRAMLAGVGFSARGQDVYGCLLSCADLVLHDALPDSDSLDAWAEKMKAVLPREGEVSDDAQSCFTHLMSTAMEAPRDRERMQIGNWVARAACLPQAGVIDHPETERTRCNKILMNGGLKVVEHEGQTYLAVANRHTGLARLFENTQWAAAPGADGVWKQSLERLAERAGGKCRVNVWFSPTLRSTLLPVSLLLPAKNSQPEPVPPPDLAAPLGPLDDDFPEDRS